MSKNLKARVGTFSPIICVGAFSRRVLATPVLWLCAKIIFHRGAFSRWHDVVIAQLGPRDLADAGFEECAKAALDYLAKVDRRRFARVRQYVRAVLRAPDSARYGGKLLLRIGVCMVNFLALDYGRGPIRAVKVLACTLVHEATHGHIAAHSISYQGDAELKIERICIEEEVRLSRRFDDGEAVEWERSIREKLQRREGARVASPHCTNRGVAGVP